MQITYTCLVHKPNKSQMAEVAVAAAAPSSVFIKLSSKCTAADAVPFTLMGVTIDGNM